MANLKNCMQRGLKVQSEPVPAACINKQHFSGSPSRSLPSDKLYLLTTKLGEFDRDDYVCAVYVNYLITET